MGNEFQLGCEVYSSQHMKSCKLKGDVICLLVHKITEEKTRCLLRKTHRVLRKRNRLLKIPGLGIFIFVFVS